MFRGTGTVLSELTDASLRTLRRPGQQGAKRERRRLPDGASFEGFVLRGQVLKTYRDMVRTAGQIGDPDVRRETRQFVRDEFRSCRNIKDTELARSLLIGGIRQFKSVSNNLGLSHSNL